MFLGKHYVMTEKRKRRYEYYLEGKTVKEIMQMENVTSIPVFVSLMAAFMESKEREFFLMNDILCNKSLITIDEYIENSFLLRRLSFNKKMFEKRFDEMKILMDKYVNPRKPLLKKIYTGRQ